MYKVEVRSVFSSFFFKADAHIKKQIVQNFQLLNGLLHHTIKRENEVVIFQYQLKLLTKSRKKYLEMPVASPLTSAVQESTAATLILGAQTFHRTLTTRTLELENPHQSTQN